MTGTRGQPGSRGRLRRVTSRRAARLLVNNGVPDFHKRMSELEAEHVRVSALPREKPKVRRIATVTHVGDNWVVNIGLGTLREQLQHVEAI